MELYKCKVIDPDENRSNTVFHYPVGNITLDEVKTDINGKKDKEVSAEEEIQS